MIVLPQSITKKPTRITPRLFRGHPINRYVMAHYPFSALAGNVVHDISQNKDNGSLNGSPVWGQGLLGRSLDFDGTGDYVSTSNLSYLNGATKATFCAWIELNTLGVSSNADDGGIISRSPNGFARQILFWYNVNAGGTGNRTYSFNIGDTFDSTNRVDGTDDIAVAGKPQFVVGVMDGGNRLLYVDGKLNASASGATQTSIDSAGETARLGGWQGSANYDLNGKIYDLRIYKDALTAKQIESLYSKPWQTLSGSDVYIYSAPAPAPAPAPTPSSLNKRQAKRTVSASVTKATAIDYSGGDVTDVDYDAVYIGGAGSLVVVTKEGDTITFDNLQAGTILPIAIIQVTQTGSTATGLLGLTW